MRLIKKINQDNSLHFYPAIENCTNLKSQHPGCAFKKLSWRLFAIAGSALLLSSCSVSKKISRLATKILLRDSAISTGHIGISIYEPATSQYWYNYDATKYFVPASNTKLFSLYAGMKYLGDSLVGLRYTKSIQKSTTDRAYYYIQASGDPTFLHPDFANQPVVNFLKNEPTATFELNDPKAIFNPFGRGWAWDDYNSGYMAERSSFPVYGNEYTFYLKGDSLQSIPPELPIQNKGSASLTNVEQHEKRFSIRRNQYSNEFSLITDTTEPLFTKTEIPYKTNVQQSVKLLQDAIKNIHLLYNEASIGEAATQIIHSQPSDSLFKPMMHRSDNFFAEQTLLMASNEHLGYLSDEKMIDTLLSTDLKDIPQKPKWVDGSGLSRYNLFTPQSFVYLLNKMKNEFGLERLKNILPTGGEGTLAAYYKKDAGYIFAKTGTLSNHCGLSGFIITKKNKLLIFSVLVNHYQTGATPVRRAIEKFLLDIREKY